MKKLAVSVAAMAMFSTVAMADDFDNTSVAVSAQGEKYGVELSTNETTRSAKISVNSLPVDLAAKVIDLGSTMDYELSVGKKVTLPLGGADLYVAPEATFAFGDSYTDNQLTLTPKVGVTGGSTVKPYAELGLNYSSTTADITDINRGTTFAKVGATMPLSTTVALDVNVTRNMTKDFDKVDNQAGVKLVVKF